MSCNICCDDYNKSSRSKICCIYCDFDVCRTCCETYILSSEKPKCMKPDCAKEWSRKFLRENFTNTFLNSKYKIHLEEILFDKEKALLPATQPLVEERIKKNNLKKEINEIELLIRHLNSQKIQLEYRLNRPVLDINNNEKADNYRFVRQCPANKCRGFLSTQWKCGICEQWTCPDCHELKGPNRDCNHVCNPSNIETAKLLAKDSKPCPKCQSLIFKIDGCDQMWCTQCHTGFSWKTGNIENNIHNPHFYEWQRLNGKGAAPRNPGDFECGRDITNYLYERIQNSAVKHNDLFKMELEEVKYSYGSRKYKNRNNYSASIMKIGEIIRNTIHNTQVELPYFQTDYVIRNQELRIKYMESSISENDFKILIQRNDKKNKKNTEIAQVFQLVNTTLTDILYRLLDNLDKSLNGNHNVDNFLQEISQIVHYCNDILSDISFTYNTIQYKFEDNLHFVRVEKEKKEKEKKKSSNDSDNDNSIC